MLSVTLMYPPTITPLVIQREEDNTRWKKVLHPRTESWAFAGEVHPLACRAFGAHHLNELQVQLGSNSTQIHTLLLVRQCPDAFTVPPSIIFPWDTCCNKWQCVSVHATDVISPKQSRVSGCRDGVACIFYFAWFSVQLFVRVSILSLVWLVRRNSTR